MFIFLFMTDLFITNTKDRPCISPPVYKPSLYNPIKNRLRKYISPGLIVGGLRYLISQQYGTAIIELIPDRLSPMNLSSRLCACVKSLVKPREKSIAFLRKINVGSRKSVDLILNDQVDIIHVVLNSANVSRCIVMRNMYYCFTLEFYHWRCRSGWLWTLHLASYRISTFCVRIFSVSV
jgi:hypothetical protein